MTNKNMISDDLFWAYISDIKPYIIEIEEGNLQNQIGVGLFLEYAFELLEPGSQISDSFPALQASRKNISQDQLVNKIISLIYTLESKELRAAYYIYWELRLCSFCSEGYLYFHLYIIVLGHEAYLACINNKAEFEKLMRHEPNKDACKISISGIDFEDYFMDEHNHFSFYKYFEKNNKAKSWLKESFSKLHESNDLINPADIYPEWYTSTSLRREDLKKYKVIPRKILILMFSVLIILIAYYSM